MGADAATSRWVRCRHWDDLGELPEVLGCGCGVELVTRTCPGLALSALTIPVMYLLSCRKLSLAERLGSRALRADAVESLTCGWLAVVVIAALLAQLAIGAWWLDAVASLAIVWFVIREGREAWGGDECCNNLG